MTQEGLLDAVVEDLRELFRHHRLHNSLGIDQEVRVFPQDVPIREGDDEGTDPEAPPEPYITVRLQEGQLPGFGEQQTITVVIGICVYDPDINRQGYRDVLHIINEIMLRYGANGVVGRRYEAQYPIKWAVQEDDTHPYYFGAVGLRFEGPVICREVPET